MWRRNRSSPAAEPRTFWRRRRIVICGGVILAVVVLLLFGRGILAWWARQTAARQMSVGALSAAQRWLAWSARLDPGHGETELMQAACFRRLFQQGRWKAALESAEQKGAPAARIEQELRLGAIQAGNLDERAENLMGALIEGGLSPHEVAMAFVHGYLARQEPEKAKTVLDAWEADYPQEADVAYMRGVYWRWMGNERRRAQTEFENTLARQPQHELARTALAGLLEEQDQLDQALKHYVELATRAPESRPVQMSMARVLRRLRRLDEARAVLKWPASRPEPPSEVAAEMGQIELESGNYEEAERWFAQADLVRREDQEILSAAAATLALAGKMTRAERLFAWLDAAKSRSTRIHDLMGRLATGPHDRRAADELQRLSAPSGDPPPDLGVSGTGPSGKDGHQRPATSGPELYALHCAACHGATGDGNGRAAQHLFPRPRDLRTGKSRLVSTRNGVPTLEDLEAVIRQGMPGTSMRAFDDLAEDQRKRLAEEVLRLNREGVREQFTSALKREGEEINEEEVREVVELCTTPGEVVRVPEIGPEGPQSIARGKETYFELSCDNCHGADGTGAWDTPWFDDKGRLSPPRDLVHEPFKGGPEPESIYLRVLLGMPGTPHPACYNVPEEQLIGLVHYCRWLSREPKRVLTNHQRAIEATSRVYPTAFVFETMD